MRKSDIICADNGQRSISNLDGRSLICPRNIKVFNSDRFLRVLDSNRTIRRPRGRSTPHDQHAGHGQRAEHVEQVAFFQHRPVAVYQVTDGSLGQLHMHLSRICDVQPTTGVRCTGRLSGRETGMLQ